MNTESLSQIPADDELFEYLVGHLRRSAVAWHLSDSEFRPDLLDAGFVASLGAFSAIGGSEFVDKLIDTLFDALRRLNATPRTDAIWAGTNGYLDDVPTPKVREFEAGFYRFLEQNHADLLPTIASERAISDASQDALKTAVTAYRRDAGYGEDAKDAKEAKTDAPADAGEGAPTAEEAAGEAEATEEAATA